MFNVKELERRISVLERRFLAKESQNPTTEILRVLNRVRWRHSSSEGKVFRITSKSSSGKLICSHVIWNSGVEDWIVGSLGEGIPSNPFPNASSEDYEVGGYYYVLFIGGEWWLLPKGSGYQWAAVSQIPSYDSSYDYYLVKKLILVNNEWQWDLSDEIEINRAIGYEGYSDVEARDIRNWVPWWPVDSIVRIIERWDDVDNQMRWFIAEPMIYAGKPENATLRHHPTDGIVQCVWQ